MNVSADKAVGQRPHSVSQDVSADGLHDVLDELRTVGFDAAPFLLGVDAHIRDGLATKLVLSDTGLDVGQASTRRQRDKQHAAVDLKMDAADLLRNPHLDGSLHRLVHRPPVSHDIGIGSEFSRRIGDKEEDAFLNGDGSAKPTGILHDTLGGQVGVTAASATAITADELVDLYYSLKAPYRKNAIWILNDATIRLIRKLKSVEGQYLWQPGLKDGEVNTILGRPYFTSPFMPTAEAGAKAILFGDLSYYWIGDRQGIAFRRLNELYAGKGQVGFMASKRLDGRTVLPEAIQLLQMKNA